MALRYHSSNMPLSSIINKYGDLNQNQINCLNCRSSMYVVGAVVAKEMMDSIEFIEDAKEA